jgi:hypothetical protein
LTPSAIKLIKNIPSALMKLPELFKSMWNLDISI